MTIRVLLADDQPLIRAGFRMFVEPDPGVEVVGEAGTGREAVALARSTRADVVLMDLRMPDMDGIEATRQIAAAEDLAGVRVLVLTTFENDDNVVLALRAGASGFLGKHVDPVDLLHAIRVVAAGEALLSPAATRGLVSRFLSQPVPNALPAAVELGGLTDREREVLDLVAAGHDNREIAERLVLSVRTVERHLQTVYRKLDLTGSAQRTAAAALVLGADDYARADA